MNHFLPAVTALRQTEQEPREEELSNGSQANQKAHQPLIPWCLFLSFHLEIPTEEQAGMEKQLIHSEGEKSPISTLSHLFSVEEAHLKKKVNRYLDDLRCPEE